MSFSQIITRVNMSMSCLVSKSELHRQKQTNTLTNFTTMSHKLELNLFIEFTNYTLSSELRPHKKVQTNSLLLNLLIKSDPSTVSILLTHSKLHHK